MPREPIPQEQVLETLATLHTDIKCEADRQWLWIVEPDLAPLHKKCNCEECKARAEKREAMKAIGFRFAFKPHLLPSGKTARWGHCCSKPLPFRKRKQTASGDAPHRAEAEDDLSEAEAFFKQ